MLQKVSGLPDWSWGYVSYVCSWFSVRVYVHVGGVRSKGVPGVGGAEATTRSAWLKVCICVAPGLSLQVSDVLLCDWRMSSPTRVC